MLDGLAAFFETACRPVVCNNFLLLKPHKGLVLAHWYSVPLTAPFAVVSDFVDAHAPGNCPRYPLTVVGEDGILCGGLAPANTTDPLLFLICLCKSLCCLILYSKSEIWACSHVHRDAIDARSVAYFHAARLCLKSLKKSVIKYISLDHLCWF